MARHEHWPKLLWLYGISKKWLPQAPAILEPNLDDFVEHTKETASAANAARNLSSSLEEAKLQLESSEQQKLLLRERGLTAEASNGFCLSFWIFWNTTGEWNQRTADMRRVHQSLRGSKMVKEFLSWSGYAKVGEQFEQAMAPWPHGMNEGYRRRGLATHPSIWSKAASSWVQQVQGGVFFIFELGMNQNLGKREQNMLFIFRVV